MRKLLVLALVLGMAALAGDWAGASGANDNAEGATPSGVRYDWWGSEGELSIVGEPGTTYAVYDRAGNPVAHGELAASKVSFIAGNSGVGPDGVIVFVLVGGEVLAVTDLDWEWN